MAEIVDVDADGLGEIEAVEKQLEPENKAVNTDLPEKYRGKNPEELIKMHQEAEKMMSRQAQEVGEVRKLADELLKTQLKPEQEKQEVDFFENPNEAIRQAVENNPKVIASEQAMIRMQQDQAKTALAQKYPDASEIIQDAEFVNWVKSSPIRTQLFQMAHNYNMAAADELLGTFKQLKTVRQNQELDVDKEIRKNSMRAASVDVGGAGESGKKVLRRADLIRLKMNDPVKYESMQDEIFAAYAEGRVK